MPSCRSATFAALALVLLTACARHAAAQKPETRGAVLFAAHCAVCHGERGLGGTLGPALANERKRKTLSALTGAIEYPEPPMPKLYPARLSERDVDDIATFVETL